MFCFEWKQTSARVFDGCHLINSVTTIWIEIVVFKFMLEIFATIE